MCCGGFGFGLVCFCFVFALKSWPSGLASRHKFSTCMQHKFFAVWPTNTSRHKLIASHLYTRGIYDFLRLANPFGHPLQVRFCKLASSPFDRGLTEGQLSNHSKGQCTRPATETNARFSKDQYSSVTNSIVRLFFSSALVC